MTTASKSQYMNQAKNRFLRSNEVNKLTGLSRSTIWRLQTIGEFPSRKKLSAGAVGWLLSEVEEWMESREAII